MKKRYYIAYGSNLNVAQMKMRCKDAKVYGTSMLTGWELLFKGSKTGSYLTIEKANGGRVPVAIWEVSEEDERMLDIYEGYPTFYYKKDVALKCVVNDTGEIKKINAFVYIMHEDRHIGIPSNFYMRVCLSGYDSFGFNKNILINAYNKCRKAV